MKLVLPYTYVHPPTVEAIVKWPHPVEWHYVGQSGDDYLDLLRKLLAEKKPFLLCEHDVVPTENQLFDLLECPKEWCCYIYREEQRDIGPPLGLCRFRETFLDRNQDLFSDFIRGESWTRLNGWINGHALGVPHLHGPPFVRNDSRPR